MMQASLQRVPQLDAVIKAVSPLKRAAVPEEVVDYIIFLCSPGDSYIVKMWGSQPLPSHLVGPAT